MKVKIFEIQKNRNREFIREMEVPELPRIGETILIDAKILQIHMVTYTDNGVEIIGKFPPEKVQRFWH